MRRVLFILLSGCIALSTFGQQQATIAQYMFNGLAINPAYAGSHDAMSITFLSRFQNVGLPGAPNTQSLAAHTPLVNDRVALGFLVVHDNISVIDQTGVNGIYAYRIPFKKGTLAMGIQAGFTAYQALYSSLETYQPDILFSQDVRQMRPNFGAGLYYNSQKFFAGISMPHMVNNVFERGTNFETIRQSSPLIITGGYVFTLNRIMKVKPNFLFKYIDGRPVEMDINANFLFDEVLWAGISYSMSKSINLILQMQISDQFRFGYSYTVSMGPIQSAELGSHELMLNYRFKRLTRGIVTPRYF
ncbi:MAG: type IX secretion system membrane protein PorP/SprF [Bacteroidetes bacterium]|nr:type IX secretion system membrane protein PorP/SprF [Bacteroidota bacterium]